MVATIAAGTSAGYYLEQSEYYVGGGEPQGRWVAFDDAMGVQTGQPVVAADFERLHAGLRDDGSFFVEAAGARAERCPGYDLTLSAPKSVSILWAVADEETRGKIEHAQARAADAALKLLNDEAAYCRRGRGGAVLEKVQLTAAVFQHGEARPAAHEDGSVWADPQLHSHAVILNMAARSDGSFGALDGRHLFRHKMATGAAYHAQLAAELNQLGFVVEVAGKNGIFEIVGVEESVRRHFSSRREAIETAMAEHGIATADAPELAAAITATSRLAKDAGNDTNRHTHWRAELAGFGLEPHALVDGLRRTAPMLSADQDAEIARRMAAIPAKLTETESVFERRHLLAAVATCLVGTGAGADRAHVEVDRLLGAGAIVPLQPDALGQPQFSTTEMIRIEREVCVMAERAATRLFSAIDQAVIRRSCRDARLSGEQHAAVLAATDRSALAIVEGAAGSGKTTTLIPIAAAYRQSGYRVIGAAAAWRVAHALRDDLGIEARATDSWIASANAGASFLDHRTVLIVDEAGQLSSRQMHVLLRQAEQARAKVILTGDREQLQPIGPGPALAQIAARIGTTRLDTIVRQRDAWARQAARNFANGNAAAGLAAYQAHGLISEHDGAKAVVRGLVTAWETARCDGEAPLVLAKTNAQVRVLNAEIRTRLRASHILKGADVPISAASTNGRRETLPIAAGDEIRFLIRNDDLRVVNGTTAKVIAVRPEADGHGQITARIDDRTATFSTREITDQRGIKLAHAYAGTFYSAQGTTTERAMVLIDPSMNRHDIYVAASRSRGVTQFFFDRRLVDAQLRGELPLTQRREAVSDQAARRVWLSERLARSHSKRTTIEFDPQTAQSRTRSAEIELD